MNTLKEMLLDERKLVTYVSLSKEMCIHVNESKSLLKEIIDYLKKKDPDIQLNINYMISGLLETNKAQTTVCNETELDKFKNNLKVLFYQHVYSVSVGTPSVDNVSLMALNNLSDFSLCTGLVKSNSCVKRSPEEIGGLKTNSQQNVMIEQKPSSSGTKVVKQEKKNDNNKVNDVKQVTKIQETKSEPIIKSETISPKKESSSNNVQKSDNKKVNKSQKGIAGFFNKSNSVPAKKVVNGTKEIEQKNSLKQITPLVKDTTEVKVEKMDVDEEVPEQSEKVIEVSEQSKKVVESKKQDTVAPAKEKNKTLNTIKKNAKVDKKRKRVLHVSDSEDEEEKDDPFKPEPVAMEDSEDEIPPTPLVNTVKITSGIVNPKKKRKIVDKTYTDEDGYILTKKEEIYESCSENEEEASIKENVQHINKVKKEVSPPEKKNATKNTKKKIASPQKGKQATLMSFFKKVPQK
ncbi:DNA polymerase delta subunit 3 [Ostrinia nubilalis]|uniref:DNA polymerase delta subunit 3 n=1 Tax=Ostrinia nubilalis TaxID=29057 RepID=UPI0030824AE8